MNLRWYLVKRDREKRQKLAAATGDGGSDQFGKYGRDQDNINLKPLADLVFCARF